MNNIKVLADLIHPFQVVRTNQLIQEYWDDAKKIINTKKMNN